MSKENEKRLPKQPPSPLGSDSCSLSSEETVIVAQHSGKHRWALINIQTGEMLLYDCPIVARMDQAMQKEVGFYYEFHCLVTAAWELHKALLKYYFLKTDPLNPNACNEHEVRTARMLAGYNESQP